MAREPFLLVSLSEDKAKKLAQVVTNDSCRKILNYLSENDSTESELAEKLQIPISTVHYNLKQLVDAGLVFADEYHYSKKGKEVMHYKLANKYIIIAPKSTYGIKEKLRGILPAAILTLAAASSIHLYSIFSNGGSLAGNAPILAQKAVMESAPAAADLMLAAPAIPAQSPINPAVWFLIGAVFVFVVLILIDYIRVRKK